jgi:peptidoglycan hydrolase-like protein with peptidoglycan-binding domain
MKPGESFVGQPVRSLQTMLRVIAEDGGYIPTVVPDGIYGPGTMSSVAAFQRYHGLPVSGVTDQATWEKVGEIYDLAIVNIGKTEPIEVLFEPGQVFRLGDSGPYLYLTQSMLIWLSIDNLSIPEPNHTGVLDRETADALRAFQLLSGLPETGELDRNTWKNLSKQFTLSAHHHAADPTR